MTEVSSSSTALGEKGYQKKEETSLENARMRTGKRLVIAGFCIAIIGIVLYCIAVFSGDFSGDQPVVIKELGVIGLGTLVWLVGAVKYLNGAIDSNASDDDL